jgi:putative ABC transport system permease protein
LTLAICGSGTAGVIAAGVLAEINLIDMRARLGTLGGNLLVVSPNKLPPFPGRPRQLEHFISLLPEDGAALQKLAGTETVVPVIARETTIRMNNRGVRVRLIGTTSDYLNVRSFTLDHGRFFSTEDDGRRVIVLGSAVSRELGTQGVRAGHIVFLGGNPYTVIGVLRPQGVNFAGEDEDHQVFIPITTYQQRVANRFWLTSLYIQLPQGSDSQSVVKGVQTLLRQRHGRWDYQVDDTVIRNLADLAAEQSELLTTVVWVVTVTSALLLLTGVAGVTTLMLLVVRQRRSEIGLRRALGATPVDIAFQFFIEGIVLAGAGILIGLAFGFGGSYFAVKAFALQPVWTSNLPLLGVFLSLTASIVACIVPAIVAGRAGRLEPSVALQP